MKEIFRSFEGKLGPDNQSGFIVYETDSGKIRIETLSVWENSTDGIYMIPYQERDWSKMSLEELGELLLDIDDGRIPGEVYYKEKWRNPQKLQDKYRDCNWKKYI